MFSRKTELLNAFDNNTQLTTAGGLSSAARGVMDFMTERGHDLERNLLNTKHINPDKFGSALRKLTAVSALVVGAAASTMYGAGDLSAQDAWQPPVTAMSDGLHAIQDAHPGAVEVPAQSLSGSWGNPFGQSKPEVAAEPSIAFDSEEPWISP